MTGGRGFNSVEYYKISTNQWHEAPAMNSVRYDHGSCCFEDVLYVFGGKTAPGEHRINAIEYINAYHVTVSNAQWNTIEVSGEIFDPRTDISVARISEREIVILGGSVRGGKVGDAYKFDIYSEEMSKIFDDGTKLYNVFNQCMQTKPGQVVALVEGLQESLNLIAYNLGDSSITTIEDLGGWRE